MLVLKLLSEMGDDRFGAMDGILTGCLSFDSADISVYPESILPLPRGAAGNAL